MSSRRKKGRSATAYRVTVAEFSLLHHGDASPVCKFWRKGCRRRHCPFKHEGAGFSNVVATHRHSAERYRQYQKSLKSERTDGRIDYSARRDHREMRKKRSLHRKEYSTRKKKRPERVDSDMSEESKTETEKLQSSIDTFFDDGWIKIFQYLFLKDLFRMRRVAKDGPFSALLRDSIAFDIFEVVGRSSCDEMQAIAKYCHKIRTINLSFVSWPSQIPQILYNVRRSLSHLEICLRRFLFLLQTTKFPALTTLKLESIIDGLGSFPAHNLPNLTSLSILHFHCLAQSNLNFLKTVLPKFKLLRNLRFFTTNQECMTIFEPPPNLQVLELVNPAADDWEPLDFTPLQGKFPQLQSLTLNNGCDASGADIFYGLIHLKLRSCDSHYPREHCPCSCFTTLATQSCETLQTLECTDGTLSAIGKQGIVFPQLTELCCLDFESVIEFSSKLHIFAPNLTSLSACRFSWPTLERLHNNGVDLLSLVLTPNFREMENRCQVNWLKLTDNTIFPNLTFLCIWECPEDVAQEIRNARTDCAVQTPCLSMSLGECVMGQDMR